MKTSGKAFAEAVTALLTLLSISCIREPIYDVKSAYRIEIDTEYDMLYNRPAKAPSLYRVLFFDQATKRLVTSNTVGGNGGYLYNITPGIYDIVIYNYTMNRTKVSHEDDLNSLQALTTILSYQDHPVVETPDHLFVRKLENVRIPHLTVNDTEFVLKAETRSVVDSWCLVIDGIKGLKNAACIDISISGQAQTVFLNRGKGGTSGTDVTIFFPAICDFEENLIRTPFNTFGRIRDPSDELVLKVRITGSTGEEYIFEENVSGQFADPENREHIISATFDITVKGKKDGGMSPVTDLWNPEIEVIHLQ